VASERKLACVLGALTASNIPVVIFKGEHVARACYARPDLRPRTDIDLLIHPSDRERASEALRAAGYRPAPRLEASMISYQATFVAADSAGRPVDLHWRLSNPQAFADVLTVGEIFDAARELRAPTLPARVPSTIHALVIALIHRVSHHAGSRRLIWDRDVVELSAQMGAGDWMAFVAFARERSLTGLFLQELTRALSSGPRVVSAGIEDVLRELRIDAANDTGPLLREHPTRAGEFVANIRALRGWRQRAALLVQHCLPPRRYMRDVYAPASRAPLPVLYVRRMLAGAWKYCRPTAG
jgi:hypothetical protein